MPSNIRSVMVVGYGTMGRGIVKTFGKNGFETYVLIRDPSRVQDVPEYATVITKLPENAPDLIIESIPEEMALKHELFTRLETAYGTASIYATNTSGLPIDQIAAPLKYKQNFIAVHYMQPAESFPLVEVCQLEETSEKVVEKTVTALYHSGKDAIILKKPIIGFLINRLQHAMLHEAYCMIEDGITTAADVDKFARLGFGPRMCITGLIEQKDLSGIDVNAAAQRSIVPDLYHTGKPSKLVQDMAARGDIGVKSGKGFYDWTKQDISLYQQKNAAKLKRLWAALDDQ